jgi:molecular chaperone GrpE
MDPVNDQTEQTEQETTPPEDTPEAATTPAEPANEAASAETDASDAEESDAGAADAAAESDTAEADAADSAPGSSEIHLDEIIDMEKLQLQKTISQRDDRIASLEGQLSELTARLRTVSSAYKKQQDDVSATRKRLERHSAQREEVQRGKVVSGLFEPVENLRRSREALLKSGVDGDNLTGLDMVLSQFMAAFDKLGLEEVPGKGARFDPKLHEALTTMPVMDPALEDVVVEVFSAGYRVGTFLIQPARVIVGRYTAPEPDPEEAEVVDADVVDADVVDADVIDIDAVEPEAIEDGETVDAEEVTDEDGPESATDDTDT